MAKIEGSARCLTDIELLRFADALGCQIEDLFPGARSQPATNAPSTSAAQLQLPPIPAISFIYTDDNPVQVPDVLVRALLAESTRGGKKAVSARNALRGLHATPQQVQSLQALAQIDADGSTAITLLGEEAIEAKIYPDGEIEIEVRGTFIVRTPTGRWMLEGSEKQFRTLRDAIQSAQ